MTCTVGDQISVPGLRKSSGVGNDCPLQYSHMENSMEINLSYLKLELRIFHGKHLIDVIDLNFIRWPHNFEILIDSNLPQYVHQLSIYRLLALNSYFIICSRKMDMGPLKYFSTRRHDIKLCQQRALERTYRRKGLCFLVWSTWWPSSAVGTFSGTQLR